MDRRAFCLTCLALPALALRPAAAKRKFRQLYNGRDLSGWHVESGKLEAWKADGEVISTVGKGGGYLATDAEYGDFELRLEYRIPKAANSGVGLRFPRGGWPSTQGMEIQLLDDDAPQYKDLHPSQYNGGVYGHVAPKTRAAKPPGAWNRLEIRCKGPEVRVKLNGVEIQDINMDEHTQPGSKSPSLAQMPRRGLVGLQHHGDPVDFRKIEIREL